MFVYSTQIWFWLLVVVTSILINNVSGKCKSKEEPCKWIDNECQSKEKGTTARCAKGKICRNYHYINGQDGVCPDGYNLDRTVRCTGDGQNTENFKHFCCKDGNYSVKGLPYLTPQDFHNGKTKPDVVSHNIPTPHDPVMPSSANKTRSAAVKEDRWPLAQIPYYINYTGAGWTWETRAEIAKAIQNYEENTCLRFYSAGPFDRSWISIENDASVNTPTNCGLSVICGPWGGSQFCSVGPACANAEWLVHELGHSLCFGHEHQREDRDKYIRFDETVRGCSAATYPLNSSPRWSTQNLPFDFSSIMLYPGCKPGKCFQRQPGQGSAVCGENGDGTGRLSEMDIIRVNLYHNCDCTKYKCK